MDTKTDFNLNNIIATLSLISISSVKNFAGKCPNTSVLKLDLNSARWMPKLVSIDAQSYPALTSPSLRATIGPLQDNGPLIHFVIGISGILPYNRNVNLGPIRTRGQNWNCLDKIEGQILSWQIFVLPAVPAFKISKRANSVNSTDYISPGISLSRARKTSNISAR